MTAYLLINTGSPTSPEKADVRRYLREFLMDERVIDISFWKRFLLVYGIISVFRTRKSSEIYQRIWTEDGSPLISITDKLVRILNEKSGNPVFYAMRYGSPSIASVLEKIQSQGFSKIKLIPMFPHYAMSTFESVVVRVKEECSRIGLANPEVIAPYYKESWFINAWENRIREYLNGSFDHILFSYHSLPLRHIHKSDITGSYCLQSENCCITENPAHEFCYRAQVFETTRLIAEKLKIGTYSVTFQSALKAGSWLGPDTEETISELAIAGKKKIMVVCPGFVTDNLETIDEIGIRGKEMFLKSGGSEFVFVPSLNTQETWVDGLIDTMQD